MVKVTLYKKLSTGKKPYDVIFSIQNKSPMYMYIYVTPPGLHHHTEREREAGALQRLQPLASVARAPLFEVRGVRFTHSPYWHTSVTYIYIYDLFRIFLKMHSGERKQQIIQINTF